MQLSEALDETEKEVTTMGLHESPPEEMMKPNALNALLMSVAGVGEPPDNARKFYEWLMSPAAATQDWSLIDYTVFGLGNQKAHPNHFNVIGKAVDARLQELGANRVHEMGLGDDGECIEDDFDVWLAGLLKSLNGSQDSTEKEALVSDEDDLAIELVEECDNEHELHDCHGASDGRRIVSLKYTPLLLKPSESDVIHEDLLHLKTSFYQSDCQKLTVIDNRLLSVHSGEYGLREMRISIDAKYEAGDHFVLYPKNSHCLVEAYLNMLNVDPHAIVNASGSARAYPHPTGITLFETLLHCIDLGATPSPAFSRELLGRKSIDYKNEIALPRRTVLDLALESGRPLSLEEVLYNMPHMQPRYYSIASSPLVHPQEVYLTYRPVKYVSSRGAIREGVCTNYMVNLGSQSQVVGAVRSNPTFRLPKDPAAPVLMMAGGCGIAAIRAFLEERLSFENPADFGEGHLFLGFRTPEDEVYRDMVDRALETGVLSNVQMSYSSGCTRPDQQCRLVSDTVRANGKEVWDLFENGGYTYLCGGARTFGAAVAREVIGIIEEHGNMSTEDATLYLQQLIKEGRYCEDLAD